MNETDLQKVLLRVSGALVALAVPFHVTGGVAVSNYGRPRMTLDVDLVVRIGNDSVLQTLVDALSTDFYIDFESARSAIHSNQMFQALDNETFTTVDFHVGERIPGELERSIRTEVFPGVEVPFASAEDTLLSKLIWYRMGSDRSWEDALYIVRRQQAKLDRRLLIQLAEDLQISKELTKCMDEGMRGE